MTDVPLADPDIGPAALDRVETLLESGMLADGPEVRAFEDAFAEFCGVDHGVATSNGTTALTTALRALGVEEGNAVVTSPFSFVASANAIRLAGGRPVFADVDPETLTVDPQQVAAICRRRDDVVGILPVHLYGCPAQMQELSAIADRHECFVLEDACQAHGAKIEGTTVGAFGDAACFSFYPTKNMTTGEGGMITTDRPDVADRAGSFVNHGRNADDGGYEHARLGHNHRMTAMAAAIGRSQLERLPTFTADRREIAQYYDEAFADLPIETPTAPDGYRHVYHQYTIRTDDRDDLRRHLDDRGIATGIYYPTPIHRQPAYESVHTAAATFPVSERAAERVLSLPVHPGVDDAARQTVVENVVDYYEVR